MIAVITRTLLSKPDTIAYDHKVGRSTMLGLQVKEIRRVCPEAKILVVTKDKHTTNQVGVLNVEELRNNKWEHGLMADMWEVARRITDKDGVLRIDGGSLFRLKEIPDKTTVFFSGRTAAYPEIVVDIVPQIFYGIYKQREWAGVEYLTFRDLQRIMTMANPYYHRALNTLLAEDAVICRIDPVVHVGSRGASILAKKWSRAT